MVATTSNKIQHPTQSALSENRITNMNGLLTWLKEERHMPRSRWAVYGWIKDGCPTVGKLNNYEWQFDLHEVALWLERNPP